MSSIVPQQVVSRLTRAAIFLVVALKPDSIRDAAIRDLFGDMSSLWIAGFYILAFVFISLAGVSATHSWWVVALMLPAAAHLFWQVARLRIHDVPLCLTLFRANRESGLLIALALAVASYA